jgi:hypothetical protein
VCTIVQFIRDGAVFEPQDIQAVSTALDDVCTALQLNGDATAKEVAAVRISTRTAVRRQQPVAPFASASSRSRSFAGLRSPRRACSIISSRTLPRFAEPGSAGRQGHRQIP